MNLPEAAHLDRVPHGCKSTYRDHLSGCDISISRIAAIRAKMRSHCVAVNPALPRVVPCGESSAAGGFPAVGDGRSRREPVLDECFPTEVSGETSAAGGETSAAGGSPDSQASGEPEGVSRPRRLRSRSVRFALTRRALGFPRHVFGGSFPRKAAAPLKQVALRSDSSFFPVSVPQLGQT